VNTRCVNCHHWKGKPGVDTRGPCTFDPPQYVPLSLEPKLDDFGVSSGFEIIARELYPYPFGESFGCSHWKKRQDA